MAGQPLFPADLTGRPEVLLDELAQGLRRFHDTFPASQCSWERRFDHLGDLCLDEKSLLDTSTWWSAEHRNLSAAEVRDRVQATPTVEKLEVCQGDPFFSTSCTVSQTGRGASSISIS